MSLEEIVRIFDLPELLMLRYKLSELKCDYRELTGTSTRQLAKSEQEFAGEVIREVLDYCTKIGFENGHDKAYAMKLRLERLPHSVDSALLALELDNLSEELTRDIFKSQFVRVSGVFGHFVNQERPFGEDVAVAFPSAANDLLEAGNCLAVGCNTAAAFHLMRVAEVGLWELGKDRQIPCAKSGKIEFTEWGKIISELEEAVIAVQQWPNSQTKEEAHKFYNSAAVEIRAFNDGWRRHSAHARPNMPKMEQDEALALWGHVSRFMNKLAGKMGETYHTPLIWE
jgi:hypothetical protein